MGREEILEQIDMELVTKMKSANEVVMGSGTPITLLKEMLVGRKVIIRRLQSNLNCLQVSRLIDE